jgi:exosortase O
MPSSSSTPVAIRTSPDGGGAVVFVVAATGVLVPLLPWWLARAASSEAWTGLLLSLVGVVVAAALPAPTTSTRATAALALCGLAGVAAGVFVDVRTVQALGAVAVVFALLAGARRVPRVSWPALGLVWIGLPLSGDVDVIGFPLRQASAALAAHVLHDAGIRAAVTETVLVAENGVADVEAPCAGLATIRLLVGVVLVVAALRQARVGRTIAALAAVVVVAVIGNAARVAALAALVLGAGRVDLAGLLHVPLGVVVFVAAVAAAAPLLVPGIATFAVEAAPARTGPAPAVRAVPAVAAVVAAVVLVVGASRARAPRRGVDDGQLAHALARVVDAADADGAAPLPLSPAESALFTHHAIAAGKRRVVLGGGDGEELVVVARSLRALHAPERCLASSGHIVVAADVVLRGGVAVKRLVLDGGHNVALSLLRSPQTHAATLGDVAVARLRGDAGPWVFVSAVVRDDGATDEDALARVLVHDANAVLAASSSSASSSASSFAPVAAGDS